MVAVISGASGIIIALIGIRAAGGSLYLGERETVAIKPSDESGSTDYFATRLERFAASFPQKSLAEYFPPDPPPPSGVTIIPEWSPVSQVFIPGYPEDGSAPGLHLEIAELFSILKDRIEIIPIELSNRWKLPDPWLRDVAPYFGRGKDGTPLLIAPTSLTAALRGTTSNMAEIIMRGTWAQSAKTIRVPAFIDGGDLQVGLNGFCLCSIDVLRENRLAFDEAHWLLRSYFGCSRVVYLEPLPGTHLDMVARILGRTVILGSYDSPPNDTPPNDATSSIEQPLKYQAARITELNEAWLKRDLKGSNIQVVTLPMPALEFQRSPKSPLSRGLPVTTPWSGPQLSLDVTAPWPSRRDQNPQPIYRSYLNFLALQLSSGRLLVVPQYGRVSPGLERNTFERLQHIWSDARVAWDPADASIIEGGATHCMGVAAPTWSSLP
jgi:agmatine/peptidylarginine deiminase